MTPLRLLIIACLLYILYRLLVGPRKRKVSGGREGSRAAGEAIQDVLVEDPVCHTYIPRGQAVQLRQDKQIYYFCSNKCYKTFLENKGEEE